VERRLWVVVLVVVVVVVGIAPSSQRGTDATLRRLVAESGFILLGSRWTRIFPFCFSSVSLGPWIVPFRDIMLTLFRLLFRPGDPFTPPGPSPAPDRHHSGQNNLPALAHPPGDCSHPRLLSDIINCIHNA
jgi:hypothetical protein